MIVDLAGGERSESSFELRIAPDEIDLAGDAELIEPVEVAGSVKPGIVETDVAGTIKGRVALECTRCLAPVEQVLEFPFEAAFIDAAHFSDAKETELRDADLDASVNEDGKIDLAELAREQILLNLPERIFCREDCRGLCAKCGANRNLVDCKCDENEIDPRWAALKELK